MSKVDIINQIFKKDDVEFIIFQEIEDNENKEELFKEIKEQIEKIDNYCDAIIGYVAYQNSDYLILKLSKNRYYSGDYFVVANTNKFNNGDLVYISSIKESEDIHLRSLEHLSIESLKEFLSIFDFMGDISYIYRMNYLNIIKQYFKDNEIISFNKIKEFLDQAKSIVELNVKEQQEEEERIAKQEEENRLEKLKAETNFKPFTEESIFIMDNFKITKNVMEWEHRGKIILINNNFNQLFTFEEINVLKFEIEDIIKNGYYSENSFAPLINKLVDKRINFKCDNVVLIKKDNPLTFTITFKENKGMMYNGISIRKDRLYLILSKDSATPERLTEKDILIYSRMSYMQIELMKIDKLKVASRIDTITIPICITLNNNDKFTINIGEYEITQPFSFFKTHFFNGRSINTYWDWYSFHEFMIQNINGLTKNKLLEMLKTQKMLGAI